MLATEKLHFEPGAGPFHVKGNVYMGALGYYDATVPGGSKAVLATMHSEGLRAFFQQRFVVGGWYDVGPLVVVSELASRCARIPHLEFLRDQARSLATRDIHGVYKFLLKMAEPAQIVARLPRTAQQYFDFVRSEILEIRPKCWLSTGHGIPEFAQITYKATTEAFITRALELAGAKQVRHRWLASEMGGEVSGVKVVTVRRELTWV